ncbi:MAG: HAD family hydrolase [Planctomycetota bacterium]|jgi:HAD superfamily hydrolase (TIGR01509 family)
MISTVIFDLDGLLADTEELHSSAYQQAFAEFGVQVSDQQYAHHWIRCGRDIAAYLEQTDPTIDPAAVRERKAHYYHKIVAGGVDPLPGSLELLSALSGRKTLALATSSHSRDALMVLGVLGFTDFFSSIVAKGDAERSKPHPDIFLKSAEDLGVAPERCVVLEDAEKGVLAAYAAGMKCIAVPNEHTADNDFSKATLVVNSLEEVDCELIDRL